MYTNRNEERRTSTRRRPGVSLSDEGSHLLSAGSGSQLRNTAVHGGQHSLSQGRDVWYRRILFINHSSQMFIYVSLYRTTSPLTHSRFGVTFGRDWSSSNIVDFTSAFDKSFCMLLFCWRQCKPDASPMQRRQWRWNRSAGRAVDGQWPVETGPDRDRLPAHYGLPQGSAAAPLLFVN